MEPSSYFINSVTAAIQNCPDFIVDDDSIVIIPNFIYDILKSEEIETISGCLLLPVKWADLFVDMQKVKNFDDDTFIIGKIPDIKQKLQNIKSL